MLILCYTWLCPVRMPCATNSCLLIIRYFIITFDLLFKTHYLWFKFGLNLMTEQKLFFWRLKKLSEWDWHTEQWVSRKDLSLPLSLSNPSLEISVTQIQEFCWSSRSVSVQWILTLFRWKTWRQMIDKFRRKINNKNMVFDI